jgi:type IV secretory pathway TrbL component
VGVKIMILFLLIGVGMALSANWVAAAKAVPTTPNPAMSALDIVGEALIFLALCWFVPKIVAGVLGGSPAFTGGEIVAVATPIVYGGMMVARGAASLAASGYGALAAGGSASSGALTASASAPASTGPMGPAGMPGVSGSTGQPGPPAPPVMTASTGQPPPPSSNGTA